jgi:hypothetical protein
MNPATHYLLTKPTDPPVQLRSHLHVSHNHKTVQYSYIVHKRNDS